jgi:pyruvate/2-oxoglutarate dehydrogenase complex dihydrolipoamide dehydrogenase (E3) component
VKYDAIIIGSGQAGNPLWDSLTSRGWTVALIERDQLGGTCINYGCTPTKTMVASAQVAHYARNAARWGVHAGSIGVDLRQVVARKNAVVQSFRGGKEAKARDRKNLRVYRGQAQFTGPHAVSVGAERLESERIFINTGTRPSIPHIEGLEAVSYLTNASLMDLGDLPEHLLVLGAGYIGLEFGQMFRRFGSDVTVVNTGGQILAREDADVAGELQKALEAEGLRFILNARATHVSGRPGRITLTVDLPTGSQQVSGSHLLIATGRKPNSDDLGLDKAGIDADEHGYITVNGRLETNVPGVWALGDVKGGPAFTHISYNDYEIVYGNLLEGKSLTTEGRIVPYCVFTDPQLGRVGLTEREARGTGRRLKLGKIPMASVARAIERDETAGMMKLVVDAESEQILGGAVLGTEGGELVHVLETLMVAGAPYRLLEKIIYIHPTLAEGLYSLVYDVKPADERP